MKPLARVFAFSLSAALFLLATGCGSDKKSDKPADKGQPQTVGDPNALPVVKDQKGKTPVINTGGDDK